MVLELVKDTLYYTWIGFRMLAGIALLMGVIAGCVFFIEKHPWVGIPVIGGFVSWVLGFMLEEF